MHGLFIGLAILMASVVAATAETSKRETEAWPALGDICGETKDYRWYLIGDRMEKRNTQTNKVVETLPFSRFQKRFPRCVGVE